MNQLFGVTLAGMLAIGAIDAQALSFTDHDEINQVMNAGNTTYSSTFNIATGDGGTDVAGYTPATQTIVSALALFAFYNPELNLQQSVGVDITGQFLPNSSLPFWFSVFGGQITGQGLLDLDATGIVSYTINRVSGSFTASWAELRVETGARAQVPDAGATAGLLGIALLGLGWFGRRQKA
jgi:hypothetical protein